MRRITSLMRRIKLPRGRFSEKEIANAYLGDFNVEQSRAWPLVIWMTNQENPSKPVLLQLAEVLSALPEI
jgi:hypothetical protein